MKNDNDDNVCEYCDKICEELVTREGFMTTYFVEWVCEKCYEKLTKEVFNTNKVDYE